MKICINAGHAPNGNPDPGTVSPMGIRESDVTDDIAQEVRYHLQQAGYGVLVIQDDDLQTICDACNDFEADLFVSIHCNSVDGAPSARGTETFCLTELSESGKLARKIQNQIVSSMGTVDRGVKTSRFYVLRQTNCPAVLVETGFLSNTLTDDGSPTDESILASIEGKENFAKCIARGVSDYFA